MNVASRTHCYQPAFYPTPRTAKVQTTAAPIASAPATPVGTAAAIPTDTVEVTGTTATPTTATTPTPGAPDVTPAVTPDEPAPTPGCEHGGDVKRTGHDRVAQNIEKKVERMIARESRRIDRLQQRLGTGEEAATSIDALKAALGDTLRGLAEAYAADPSGPPSGVLREIRQAVRDFRTDARAVLTAPAPTPAPTPETPPTAEPAPIPVATPVASTGPVAVDEPAIPTGEPAVVDQFALRAVSAYRGTKLNESTLRLVA